MDFQVGKEFEEDLTGIDDRKCMVRICPGGLPKAWTTTSGREARALMFLGTKDLYTPRSQGRQHPLIKHPPLSTQDSNGYESYRLLSLCCVQALRQLFHTFDFT